MVAQIGEARRGGINNSGHSLALEKSVKGSYSCFQRLEGGGMEKILAYRLNASWTSLVLSSSLSFVNP